MLELTVRVQVLDKLFPAILVTLLIQLVLAALFVTACPTLSCYCYAVTSLIYGTAYTVLWGGAGRWDGGF